MSDPSVIISIINPTNKGHKMTVNTITVGQAKDIIDNAINSYDGSIGEADSEKITYAINNEIQLRDYIMGLPTKYPLEKVTEFVTSILFNTKQELRYSLLTIKSIFEYELGDLDYSQCLIEVASEIKPDYNLTNLVKRVISAGWPADTFKVMREELHPQVETKLAEFADQLIQEDGN